MMARWKTLHRRKARHVSYSIRQIERLIDSLPELLEKYLERLLRDYTRRIFNG